MYLPCPWSYLYARSGDNVPSTSSVSPQTRLSWRRIAIDSSFQFSVKIFLENNLYYGETSASKLPTMLSVGLLREPCMSTYTHDSWCERECRRQAIDVGFLQTPVRILSLFYAMMIGQFGPYMLCIGACAACALYQGPHRCHLNALLDVTLSSFSVG